MARVLSGAAVSPSHRVPRTFLCAGAREALGIAVALIGSARSKGPRGTMTNAVLGLRLRQQLTLTPRLQQSVKLLQLSALECVQELHQAIAQNPFLEESPETADSRNQAEESSETTTGEDLDFSGSGSSSGSD